MTEVQRSRECEFVFPPESAAAGQRCVITRPNHKVHQWSYRPTGGAVEWVLADNVDYMDPPTTGKGRKKGALVALTDTVRQAERERARVAAAEAVRPYAGTSGWSGSETSEERARSEDASGATAMRQQAVLAALRAVGSHGMTVAEVDADLSINHRGASSGALSVLHGTGAIKRLTVRRARCQVYVMPEHVNGRPLAPHISEKRQAEPDA